MRGNIPSPQREINDLEPPACFYYALKSVNLTVPPLDYFVQTVFYYPTLAEAYKVAALDAYNRMNF
jgi:hypothetical protein